MAKLGRSQAAAVFQASFDRGLYVSAAATNGPRRLRRIRHALLTRVRTFKSDAGADRRIALYLVGARGRAGDERPRT